MNFAALDPSIQVFAYGFLAVVLTAFSARVVIFFRRDAAGVRPRYPISWTTAQAKTLERFRVVPGLALIPLWTGFLFLLPNAPTNWPFGFLVLVSLLLMSHAWVMLLIPRGWHSIGAFAPSFQLTITFLAVWWVTMFAATAWIFSKAASVTPAVHFVPAVGVFA
jgi:hypothetical protein